MELRTIINHLGEEITGTIFSNEEEFSDIMTSWQLQVNPKDVKSPLYMWREFKDNVIGLLNLKNIFFKKLTDELEYSNVFYQLSKIDMFENGYVYKDSTGFFSDEIPFGKCDNFNPINSDITQLKFDVELYEKHFIKWNDGRYEEFETMDIKRGTIIFYIQLNNDKPIKNYKELFFYITGCKLVVN